ncbi:ABC transporter permease [Basilea psittacipulmonis]|uniref:Iron ABC transporter permease n=1 Tax=Basilea psittacipulmonis DSM 24701 TaxID=1072685 RepID=A0A077DBZ3_9BURK|nr:iron chelate uptake ABC transporter family permease subunit [Basilea psittacipulmonis]AIL32174.1 iron ABC transporter permease [Basilea psittacipulmonis DSM 24701]
MVTKLPLNTLNVILLVILTTLSMTIGVADFSWANIFTQSHDLQLLLVSRIPRTLAIILTGASLSVAGMVLQIVLRNRFIEPSMTGATQSATLGILAASLLLPASSLLLKMSIATIAALMGIVLFMGLLSRLPPTQKLLVPLIGIIYGSILEALGTFIAYETDTLQLISVWFTGDFSSVLAGRYELLWLSAILVVVIYFLADRLTIAGMGKEISTGLGVSHEKMLWISLIAVALISAVVVVSVGAIPFVGLVVPNIVSRIAGDRLRKSLPSVILMGANLLLICDIVGRVINIPYEIPVSTIFGVIGTGVFLYLLMRRKYAG